MPRSRSVDASLIDASLIADRLIAAGVIRSSRTCLALTIPCLCLVLVGAAGCERQSSTATGVVTVVVDGNADESLAIGGVADGASVEDVMRKITPEQLPVRMTGSGITAFVESIDNRSTIDGKGWMFRINGQPSGVGIGSATVSPPTIIEWTYGEFESMPPESMQSDSSPPATDAAL